ncbi:hypothetical protein BDF20DRAFT_897982 [Mycotypha africana]|uniref:uncharacterized protein n=1 Tax=Mycotypha africana TaxID=64632 RepID=UPI0023008D0B|nr:uncharacterized protein BDF20DRAFT_897982 [Mycotypha africana]KAI8967940.1 hypothetical protein BDF20DRAFT_897982 [Mycotypha africana]
MITNSIIVFHSNEIMDSILIDDEKLLYLAENCIRSLITPLLVPSIVYSIITGIISVAFYGKFIRNDYFLPYLYCGNAALLYSLQHVFSLIFIKEETDIDKLTLSAILKEPSSLLDFTHENALYGSLIITTIGSFFLNLALFRLLEVWIRQGLQKYQHLTSYYLTVLYGVICALPFSCNLAGDSMLIIEAGETTEVLQQVIKALKLKLAGAACQVTLAVLYIILCLYYTWIVFSHNIVANKLLKKDENRELLSTGTVLLFRNDTPVLKKQEEQLHAINLTTCKVKRIIIAVSLILTVLGSLMLIKSIYDLYTIISVITRGPVWEIIPSIIFIDIDTILMFICAYFFNFLQLKEPVWTSS